MIVTHPIQLGYCDRERCGMPFGNQLEDERARAADRPSQDKLRPVKVRSCPSRIYPGIPGYRKKANLLLCLSHMTLP